DIVRRFFAAAGVDFPTNAGGFGPGGGGGGFAAVPPLDQFGNPLTGTRKALFYNDRTRLIFARATTTHLDVMAKAVQVLNGAPPQISLEAKFVEISQEDTKMLGFDWLLGNTLINKGKIGVQGGTAPAFQGNPSQANPTGLFPGYPAGFEPLSQFPTFP